MAKIRDVIVDVLRESGAKCGLLIEPNGRLLVRKGFTLIREIENLAVLIAASRATTQAIGKILGQEEISVIFHQGSGDHIHSADVGDQAILTLIFDDRADLSGSPGIFAGIILDGISIERLQEHGLVGHLALAIRHR